jgi:hypothetical protein
MASPLGTGAHFLAREVRLRCLPWRLSKSRLDKLRLQCRYRSCRPRIAKDSNSCYRALALREAIGNVPQFRGRTINVATPFHVNGPYFAPHFNREACQHDPLSSITRVALSSQPKVNDMPKYGYFVIGEDKPRAVWVGEAMVLHEGQKNLQIFNNGEMSTVVNIAPGCAVQQIPWNGEEPVIARRFDSSVSDAFPDR